MGMGLYVKSVKDKEDEIYAEYSCYDANSKIGSFKINKDSLHIEENVQKENRCLLLCGAINIIRDIKNDKPLSEESIYIS